MTNPALCACRTPLDPAWRYCAWCGSQVPADQRAWLAHLDELHTEHCRCEPRWLEYFQAHGWSIPCSKITIDD